MYYGTRLLGQTVLNPFRRGRGGDGISLKKTAFYIVYPGRLLNQLYCMFKKLYPLLIK